jgi:hypothetical protein
VKNESKRFIDKHGGLVSKNIKEYFSRWGGGAKVERTFSIRIINFEFLWINQSIVHKKTPLYTMANSKLSSIENRKVERKTLKARARALLRTPSSYYPVSENKKKSRAVMQELQDSVSVSRGFDFKYFTPSTLLTSNWAIESTQHAKQQLGYSNMVLVAVVTLALVAFCIRAAIFCRKFTTGVSIEKQVTVKTLHDAYGSGAKNMASQVEEKQSLEKELKSTAIGKEEHHGHNVLDMPSQISSSEEAKGDGLPPQLIFEVARSAIETTKDFSSAESTTASTVFTISTAGETKDDDNCSIDTETEVDSAKMASFCTSPLKVQEFERNLTEESNPAMTNTSAASSDKGSMLKKTPYIPIEDAEESAVLGKDAQALIGVAMKVAVAVVAVNVLVLTRRR